MNPEMLENGRRLETQVGEVMQLLADIQRTLVELAGDPVMARAGEALARQRAALIEIIGAMHQGQIQLERRLQEHVLELASREAALNASRAEQLALMRRLVQVQEEERRALARDLHDTSSQGMTAIGLGLAVLKRDCGCAEGTRARIEELQRAAGMVSEDLHRLSANLRPSTLDRYGLVPAAEALVTALRSQAGMEVEFEVEGLEERLPGDVETALYRILQEACTNIARYAGASHASVSIVREGDTVLISIEDDGKGFDVDEAAARGGLGLLGMRERAEMLGGALTVQSSQGGGTRLRAEVPVGGSSTEPALAGVTRQPHVAPVDRGVSSEIAELARAKALSDAMAEITAGVSGQTNEQEVLSFVLGRAAKAVGCDYAVIALLKGRRWIVTHAYGLPQSMIGQRLVPPAVPLALEVERTGGVVVVNDTHAGDPLARAARESGVFSGAGIPLIVAGEFLGAAAFAHSTDPVPFQPSEVGFLQHLSSVISLVLENVHLRGEDNATR